MVTAEDLARMDIAMPSPRRDVEYSARIDAEVWEMILRALDQHGWCIKRKSRGKKIVTEWLLDLWIGHATRSAQPGGDWLNRMPQRQEVDELIKAIDEDDLLREAEKK